MRCTRRSRLTLGALAARLGLAGPVAGLGLAGLGLAGLGLAGLGLAGCGPSAAARTTLSSATSAAPVSDTAASVPANPAPGGTLVIAERLEQRLGNNFNPFDQTSTLSQIGALAFVYEPLLEYNELQVDRYYPWLAESWTFSLSGETITFDIRPGVTWADGSRLTASDVAYTFNLLKDYPDINAAGIPIVSAVAINPATFTLTLSQPGWTYLYDIAHLPIVKSGFAHGHDPAKYVVTMPDGTGPFRLAKTRDASPRELVLTARAGYWQPGEPPVGALAVPA